MADHHHQWLSESLGDWDQFEEVFTLCVESGSDAFSLNLVLSIRVPEGPVYGDGHDESAIFRRMRGFP